jgi:Zn-finger nucleic acid-binding protein
MLCPACSNHLIILEHDQVEIDYCHNCGGIWLDWGELELLLDRPEDAAELLAKLLPARTDEKPRKCPICSRRMEKAEFKAANSAILIDKCKRRHGLWFDKGELESLVKASRGSEHKLHNYLLQIFGRSTNDAKQT